MHLITNVKVVAWCDEPTEISSAQLCYFGSLLLTVLLVDAAGGSDKLSVHNLSKVKYLATWLDISDISNIGGDQKRR